jgi:hypothetical protein
MRGPSLRFASGRRWADGERHVVGPVADGRPANVTGL